MAIFSHLDLLLEFPSQTVVSFNQLSIMVSLKMCSTWVASNKGDICLLVVLIRVTCSRHSFSGIHNCTVLPRSTNCI